MRLVDLARRDPVEERVGQSEAEAASMVADELAADFRLDTAAVVLAKAAALKRFEHEASAASWTATSTSGGDF